MPSPNPLGSTASSSAHGLSGVQYTASSSASGLLALFLSACSLVSLFPRSPSLSLLFVLLPLLHLSLDLWVSYRSLRSSLVAPAASMVVAPDPQARVPPSFPGSVSPASPLGPFCCLNSSPDFWLFVVSSSFSCALCVVLSRSDVSSTVVSLAWFERPSPPLFSCFASLLPGDILGFSFASSQYPVFCCYCGFAGFCFSCPTLLAGHVRLTSASISLLLGLPFRGPALVGSSSRALSESLSHAMWLLFPVFGVSPASGFAPSAATLLHPALLVAVASLRFFLCCWSSCPAGGSSGLRRLAVCSVCCSLFLV